MFMQDQDLIIIMVNPLLIMLKTLSVMYKLVRMRIKS